MGSKFYDQADAFEMLSPHTKHSSPWNADKEKIEAAVDFMNEQFVKAKLAHGIPEDANLVNCNLEVCTPQDKAKRNGKDPETGELRNCHVGWADREAIKEGKTGLDESKEQIKKDFAKFYDAVTDGMEHWHDEARMEEHQEESWQAREKKWRKIRRGLLGWL